MTPDERQLISGLFDRMRANGAGEKDREAESFINQSARQTPDSAYVLVQSVLAQEHYLQQAGSRIEELEARVRDLEAEQAHTQSKSSGGGSFLGGLFGGSKPQAQATRSSSSVPSTGGRQSAGFGQATAPGYGQAGSPWGQQPQQPQQGYAPAPGYAAPAQSAGPSFMRSALTTAAGVAGGMMAANALQNMLGGGHSAHAAGHQGSSPFEVNSAADQLRQVDAEQDQDQDDQIADQQQDAEQDAAFDNSQQSEDTSGWGSSDDSDI